MPMNTMHLAYAVEVERCGSITQAAENLYMAQPNLSKAIKELEESMGFAIFSRTSRGVVPTSQGKEFLVYARAILAEVRKMESMRESQDERAVRLRAVLPHWGRMAACAYRLVESLDHAMPLDIRLQEAEAEDAAASVAEGRFSLGIVQIDAAQASAFQARLQEKGTACQTLTESDRLALFSAHHPLADKKQLDWTELSPFLPVQFEMLCVHAPSQCVRQEPKPITVSDRMQQMELLRRIPTAYAWSLPEPAELLKRFGLIQRSCKGVSPVRVLLITSKDARLSPAEQQLIRRLAELFPNQ